MEDDNTVSKIAALNDVFRRAMRGQVYKTQGINALPPEDQTRIVEKVRLFDAFSEANDPYGEHNFGDFDHNGQRIYWRIDYYAPDMHYGSEDPSDPQKTVRVMTIMLSHEY